MPRKHVILPAGHEAESKGFAHLPYWETREFTATTKRTRQYLQPHVACSLGRPSNKMKCSSVRVDVQCSILQLQGRSPKKECMSNQQTNKEYKSPDMHCMRNVRHAKLSSRSSARIRKHIPYSRSHYPKRVWMEHISIPAMGLGDGMKFISAGK